MRRFERGPKLGSAAIAMVLSTSLIAVASAQQDYSVADLAPAVTSTQVENKGAVRLARFSFVSGNVTWRESEDSAWTTGTINLPLRQGAQIWVNDGGKAEIQFDDGSVLRLDQGSIAKLQVLYSDEQGEYTQVRLSEGTATLRVKHDYSVYEITTNYGSVKTDHAAEIRLDTSRDLQLGVQKGIVKVESTSGTFNLQSGQFIEVADGNNQPQIDSLPPADDWDSFNQSRNEVSDQPNNNLPPNIGLVAGNLDDYGVWRNDSNYGHVWCPSVADSNWRPYSDGHWTWVNPFGWTWVSNETWGWAPYHYGTWVHRPFGWAWVPGPRHQYWSPGVVHFSEYNDCVAWAPLAPSEVIYPSYIGFNFSYGDWGTYFSTGGAAIYVENGSGHCEPRPYDSRYANQPVTIIDRRPNAGYNLNHVIDSGRVFVPANASYATFSNSRTFGGGATYVTQGFDGPKIFRDGRSGIWTSGQAPLSGPAQFGTGRTFSRPVTVPGIQRPTLPPNGSLSGQPRPSGSLGHGFQTNVSPGAPSMSRPSFRFGDFNRQSSTDLAQQARTSLGWTNSRIVRPVLPQAATGFRTYSSSTLGPASNPSGFNSAGVSNVIRDSGNRSPVVTQPTPSWHPDFGGSNFRPTETSTYRSSPDRPTFGNNASRPAWVGRIIGDSHRGLSGTTRTFDSRPSINPRVLAPSPSRSNSSPSSDGHRH